MTPVFVAQISGRIAQNYDVEIILKFSRAAIFVLIVYVSEINLKLNAKFEITKSFPINSNNQSL